MTISNAHLAIWVIAATAAAAVIAPPLKLPETLWVIGARLLIG